MIKAEPWPWSRSTIGPWSPQEPAALLSSRDAAPGKRRYQYKPLEDASYVPLLKTTGHGTANSEKHVEIQLEEYSLQQAPPYKALSYTWGANERPEQITVGKDSCLNVTKNLLAFLVHLRTERPVLFWTDAICINQDDVQERGSQMRLMKQIFQQAKIFFVWLYEPPFTLFNDTLHHLVLSLDDQRIGYRPWDEVLDLGVDYRGRYKDDDRNTDMEEKAKLSIAIITVIDEGRGKVESYIFTLSLSDLMSSTRFYGTQDPLLL